LHIEATRHIDPNAIQAATNQLGQQQQEDIFNVIVHHHCKVYDDMSAIRLLFPTDMDDQDKPYGIEFVIPTTCITHYQKKKRGIGITILLNYQE
jgi:hypothetical protein